MADVDPRGAALIARLIAVATEGEAVRVADEAVAFGRAATGRWAGFTDLSTTPRAIILEKVEAVAAARRAFPFIGTGSFPVSWAWHTHKEWDRLADLILQLYSTVWTTQDAFAPTSLTGDVVGGFGLFGEHAGDALSGKVLWPVGIALALVIGLFVFSKLGGVKA